jgi:murein DD-endopeptidase MepM/ murein hydrolase activator NlpD
MLIVLAAALLVALTHAPRAGAWSWPVEGPVLRPFVLGDDPYAGGQHRGIDIGAPTGADVLAPATGFVSFAGRLPREGLCVTIRTEDGYSVTLVHLGSIALPAGTAVGEGEVVGAIGPSGELEGPEPYVHLGIRLTADPNGYLDPLSLLPVREAPQPPPPAREPIAEPVAPPAAPVSVPVFIAPKRLRASRSRSRVRPAPRARSLRPV